MIKIKVFILSGLLVFAFAGMVFAADGSKVTHNRPDRTEKVQVMTLRSKRVNIIKKRTANRSCQVSWQEYY